MDFLQHLLFIPGVAQSIAVLTVTIAIGIFLADKLKVGKFSLGVTWILFTGIFLSHFGMRLNPTVEHFAKDFGLILFVYSIGLQVGPSFFSSFGKAGIRLNLMAVCIVLLGVATAYGIHWITGTDMATMVGILSGAVTNTPGLGAAQQAFQDLYNTANGSIATGYAVAYPLGVIGILASIMLLRAIFRINLNQEEKLILSKQEKSKEPICVDINIQNPSVDHQTVKEILASMNVTVIVSRLIHADKTEEVANGDSLVLLGDTLRVLVDKDNLKTISLLGPTQTAPTHESKESNLIARRIVVTKPEWNGKKIGTLNIRKHYNVTITRINRAGIDLLAEPGLLLQLGDRIKVVGEKEAVDKVADIFGNELKRLDVPNLLPVFLGIFLGIILGTLPIAIPGLSQPFKLGLAGGSLIVAILISRFGPYYHLVTFATTSANMMVREIGISLFLAAVGLGAGESFVQTVISGGYMWILYGVIITMLPLLIVGPLARILFKVDYFSLMGLIAGSTTDPPALAYATGISPNNDRASVAYATVYPLTMFLRVMTAQLIILLSC